MQNLEPVDNENRFVRLRVMFRLCKELNFDKSAVYGNLRTQTTNLFAQNLYI